MIESNGGNASRDGSGGGSGGSIFIKTLKFSGHGSIQVNGGNAQGSGGGGSGGRLAVHVSWLREYTGDISKMNNNSLCYMILILFSLFPLMQSI